MSEFKLDEKVPFDSNLEMFLKQLDALDTEMAPILRANISKLKGITDDAARKTMRGAFNTAVSVALDELAKSKGKAK